MSVFLAQINPMDKPEVKYRINFPQGLCGINIPCLKDGEKFYFYDVLADGNVGRVDDIVGVIWYTMAFPPNTQETVILDKIKHMLRILYNGEPYTLTELKK